MKSKIIIPVVLMLLAVACKPDDIGSQGDPYLTIITDMTCKEPSGVKGNQPGFDQSCVVYNFEGDSVLIINHYNASFNCCPEEILVDFEIKGDSLIIREDDREELCRCLCLYDVEIRVHNLKKQLYKVRFEEPYVLKDTTQLIFNMDLREDPIGHVCVTRNYYPYLWQ
ncbi:MAG: hypothetical protein PHV14_02765 [Bacteroidales bacterium]|jgi:hypothetical protein|nr:hypothetical protein [Bacteroidales bacterium]MDD2813004.1 hypothetical protein [Bacteroidales bacterium]MDD3811186.1 hypothetical protein [Bacteroidales bacterium]MDD3872586.1 hypothetical protein [Bacteroidales bacterium]MDD4811632.1 hypothetical protein [Bacteroidales bacterium]